MTDALLALSGHDSATLLVKLTTLLTAAWIVHAALRRFHPQWRVWLWRAVAASVPIVVLWSSAGPQWTWTLAILEPADEPTSSGLETRPAGIALANVTEESGVSIPEDATLVPPVTHNERRQESTWSAPVPAVDTTRPRRESSWTIMLAIGWIVVALCLLARVLIQGVRARTHARRSTPAPNDVTAAGRAAAVQLALRTPVEFRVCERFASPFVAGIRRPVVVIPRRLLRDLDSAELHLVLLHELAHVRGRDIFWSSSVRTIQALLWFHPLVWWVPRAHRQACEAVCDSLAAASDRRSYRQFLARIALWTREARIAAPAGALPATADITWRLRRLERDDDYRPPGAWRRGAAMAVVVGAVGCLSVTSLALSEIHRVSAQRNDADTGGDSGAESDQTDDQPADAEVPREVRALSAADVAGLARLQGVWQAVGGNDDADPGRFSIHIDGTTLWSSIPPPLGGPRHFALDTESEPKRLVFDNGDKEEFQVYRFDGDRLQLCFNPDGGDQPTDFSEGVILRFRRLISGEQLTAVRNGLAYLSQVQQPDGSFPSAEFDEHVGVTALCTLALVNGGAMAPDDRHERIGLALDHILSRQITRREERGYFKGSGARLYDLGFGIWLLTRLHDLERYRDKVHEPLELAVEVSISAQQNTGGWGYGPDDITWSDLSNTVVQLRALAEARRQGFAVPEECFASGIEWLAAHQNQSGQFNYTAGAAGSFSCTAQALSALKQLGIDEGGVHERGWEAFAGYLDRPDTRRESWFLYGSMFAVDALSPDFDETTFAWYQEVCATLVEEQREDGSWRMDPDRIGSELSTALACLILMPRRTPVP